MKPITLLIALLALGWLAYLAWEARCAATAPGANPPSAA